jgi:Fe2+ or Zn2+ uptake regulation protein
MGPEDQYEAELANAVMGYLAQHPHAMDTVEGIAEWWVTPKTKVDLEVMRKVLDALTERGLLERIGSGDRSHYRLKRS